MILTSCAGMNQQFDCPMKGGVRCESLDQVNARVNSGEIGHEGTETVSEKVAFHYSEQTVQWHSPSTDADFYKRKPLRYGETVQHIWIAPFEDTSGNYHQESDVYTIVKPAHWIGYPVKAINEKE